MTDPGDGGDDPRKNKKRVVIDGVVEEVEASGEDSEDDLAPRLAPGKPEKRNDPQLEVLVGLTKSVEKMASGFTEMVKRDPLKEVLGAPTAGTFGQGGKVQGLFSKQLLRKSLTDNPRPIWQEMEARLRERAAALKAEKAATKAPVMWGRHRPRDSRDSEVWGSHVSGASVQI